MPDLFIVTAIAAGAAGSSLLGGALALWHKPSTLFMSTALGAASGVLLGTIAFEMLPEGLELAQLWLSVGGFAVGFAAVYAFDLFIHRGQLAGDESEQRPRVLRFYQQRRPLGGDATVLAGATSAEELIEGLSIGVGVAIQPGVAVLVGLAIAIDNLTEGLSIGELIRWEQAETRGQARRVLRWTGIIGAVVFTSSLAGWLLLRGLQEWMLGLLLSIGAGGMFYLTVTKLVPEAEEHHYQQSGAIAMAAGFLIILLLSRVS
jgi:ZIP family zinc transporter